MAENSGAKRGEDWLQTLGTFLITITSMATLNTFLVMENEGSRRMGVAVLLVIADISVILILRCITIQAGKEVYTLNRKHATGAWSLFLFSLDTKTFFILEHIQAYCSKAAGTAECDYGQISRKMITLLHTLTCCGLFIQLIGVNYISRYTHSLVIQITISSLIALLDLFDVIQLKSSLWEMDPGQLKFSYASIIYLYCFIILLVVPIRFFLHMPSFDLNREPSVDKPRAHTFSEILAENGHLVGVCLGTTVIRVLLLACGVIDAVSVTFMGKNIIMFVIIFIVKVQKLVKSVTEKAEEVQNASCLSSPYSSVKSPLPKLSSESSFRNRTMVLHDSNGPIYFTSRDNRVLARNNNQFNSEGLTIESEVHGSSSNEENVSYTQQQTFASPRLTLPQRVSVEEDCKSNADGNSVTSNIVNDEKELALERNLSIVWGSSNAAYNLADETDEKSASSKYRFSWDQHNTTMRCKSLTDPSALELFNLQRRSTFNSPNRPPFSSGGKRALRLQQSLPIDQHHKHDEEHELDEDETLLLSSNTVTSNKKFDTLNKSDEMISLLDHFYESQTTSNHDTKDSDVESTVV